MERHSEDRDPPKVTQIVQSRTHPHTTLPPQQVSVPQRLPADLQARAWRPFCKRRRLAGPYTVGTSMLCTPASFCVCQCVPIHVLPLPASLDPTGEGAQSWMRSVPVLWCLGVPRPGGTLMAGWKGRGCCNRLPASHPVHIHPPLAGHPAGLLDCWPFPRKPRRVPPISPLGEMEERRSQRKVLTEEKLWSGSCDVVMLGTLASFAHAQAQPPHWRDDLWAHRGPAYL